MKNVSFLKNKIRKRLNMKRISLFLLLAVFLSFLIAEAALAAQPVVSNTISSPVDGQEFVVNSLPANITVDGTITTVGGTINDQKVCVTVDSVTTVCEPDFAGGLGSATSRSYSIAVSIATAGEHAIQASNENSNGGHSAVSDLIAITIVLAADPCDEVDPPAYANQYLNSLNLPGNYATYRGAIIKIIAFNFNAGAYDSCHYNYAAVESDVNGLLSQLGF
jgi:hypothetical protein